MMNRSGSRSRRCKEVQRAAGALLAGKRGLSAPAPGEHRLGSGRGTRASARGSNRLEPRGLARGRGNILCRVR